jgi:hypothetical protein
MTRTTAPKGLGEAGRALWVGINGAFADLDAGQQATLEAACKQYDRATALSAKAADGDSSALRHERESSLAMARLLAALRLPDPATGKRPQLRGIRGVHQSTAKLSALDRARARSERGAS